MNFGFPTMVNLIFSPKKTRLLKIKITFSFFLIVTTFWMVIFNLPNGYCPFSIKTEEKIIIKDSRSLKEKLGQSLIVGIPSVDLDVDSENILRDLKPAGIVLYQRNFENFDQVTRLIQKLQKISWETTKKPYFIMLDEEPNGANRMGLLKDVFPLGNPLWLKIEKDIHTLSSIGINVLLAPLADFPFLPNSFIARRVPFQTTENLKAFNQTFIKVLHKNNVYATLKHFPGLGLFSDDPHHQFIQTQSDEAIIEESMMLFKDGMNSGAHFVMTSHAQYDKLDSLYPATFSRILVTDYLINQLGFSGIIMTDDLSDMPLSIDGLNLVDAGLNAIKAGHQLIMYSHQLEKTQRIVSELLERIEKDPMLIQLVEKNDRTVSLFKYRYFFRGWFLKP